MESMKLIYTLLLSICTLSLSAQELTGPANLREEASPSFKLYPNPTYDGTVYISTKNNNSTKDIVIYDVFGALVLQDKISSNRLNVSKLSPGVYAVQVTENKKVRSRKLVIK